MNSRFEQIDEREIEKTEEEKAFAVFKKQFKGWCTNCGEYGHKGVDCPKKKQCHYCKEIGHIKPNCPKRAADLAKRKNASLAVEEEDDGLGELYIDEISL